MTAGFSGEHAVIVHLKLKNGEFGSEHERDAIHRMTDRLEEVILAGNLGEFDGDEFGRNECVLYMYGPDAELLFAGVLPLLRAWPALVGGYAIKRFGPPGSPSQRVDF